MAPHNDSPTQPGQRHEWLVMLTIGSAVDFVCNDEVVTLRSGVKRIVPGNTSSEQLPVDGSRLGVLMWQARKPPGGDVATVSDTVDLVGVNMLFWEVSD